MFFDVQGMVQDPYPLSHPRMRHDGTDTQRSNRGEALMVARPRVAAEKRPRDVPPTTAHDGEVSATSSGAKHTCLSVGNASTSIAGSIATTKASDEGGACESPVVAVFLQAARLPSVITEAEWQLFRRTLQGSGRTRSAAAGSPDSIYALLTSRLKQRREVLQSPEAQVLNSSSGPTHTPSQ